MAARPSNGIGFKRELPDYEMYNPVEPVYLSHDDLSDALGLEDIRGPRKKFRCPFRRESDGSNCSEKNDNFHEILNHFYKFHFGRICSGNVFEENLNCFFAQCQDTFSTHEKLVKHIHKHEAGKESLFFLKYIIDNLEKEKKEGLEELKGVFKAEKLNFETNLQKYEKQKETIGDEHLSKIKDMETESAEKERKLKEESRHYRKKYDGFKKKYEDSVKHAEEKDYKFEEIKQKNENLVKENAARLNDAEDVKTKMKGVISDLRERNAELRGKLSIQQETTQELNIKLEKMNRKYSELGPSSESSLVKRNAKLEKQLEMAKKQIKAKEAELKEKDSEIFKLKFEDSEDESPQPSGEYVEDSD